MLKMSSSHTCEEGFQSGGGVLGGCEGCCRLMVMYRRSCERPQQMRETRWKRNNQGCRATAARRRHQEQPLSRV